MNHDNCGDGTCHVASADHCPVLEEQCAWTAEACRYADCTEHTNTSSERR